MTLATFSVLPQLASTDSGKGADLVAFTGKTITPLHVEVTTSGTFKFDANNHISFDGSNIDVTVGGTGLFNFTSSAFAGIASSTPALKATASTTALPGFYFVGDTDTGIHYVGANNIQIVAGGTRIVDVTTSGIGVGADNSNSELITLGAGSAANPALGFSGGNGTGFYYSAGNIYITRSGTAQWIVQNGYFGGGGGTGPRLHRTSNGTTPGYAFDASANSGFYYTSGYIVMSCQGSGQARITTSGIRTNGNNGFQLNKTPGLSTPAYAFVDDADTGVNYGSSNLQLVYGGTSMVDVNTNVTINGTDSIIAPTGTTAQRNGTPVNGMIRYNSTTSQLEGYANGAWADLGAAGGGSGDLLADGTVPLTANWDVGAYSITALTFTSDVATGTAPFTVTSETVVTNLNADTVDGSHATDFVKRDGTTALTANWDAGAYMITADKLQANDSNTTATLVRIANGSTGGKTWEIQSTGSAHSRSVGNLEFTDGTDTPVVLDGNQVHLGSVPTSPSGSDIVSVTVDDDTTRAMGILATHATYADDILRLAADRTDNPAFQFLRCTSDADGTPDDEFVFDGDGDATADGSFTGGGADYAIAMESESGGKIPYGTVVTNVGGKVKPAKEGDRIVGVVSARPAFLENNPLNWPKKWQRDAYGVDVRDSEGEKILNPEYDPTQEYKQRSRRDEWAKVGIKGFVRVNKNQPVSSDWIFIESLDNNTDLYLIGIPK